LKRAKERGFAIDTKDYDNRRDYIWLAKKFNGVVLNV
jgi:hypothetical protein